jgi:hypothetical protein
MKFALTDLLADKLFSYYKVLKVIVVYKYYNKEVDFLKFCFL